MEHKGKRLNFFLCNSGFKFSSFECDCSGCLLQKYIQYVKRVQEILCVQEKLSIIYCKYFKKDQNIFMSIYRLMYICIDWVR